MSFPVEKYINIKLHAEAVADAALLVYWLKASEAGSAAYHRDDLLTQADRLDALVAELRASLTEVAA